MSDVFFAELGIPPPAHHLGIHGGGHGEMTGRMLIALEQVMKADRPDCVLVYGDTNSTLAGAFAAAKLDIPVAHVDEVLARALSQPMTPIVWTDADDQATDPVVHPAVGGEGPTVRH